MKEGDIASRTVLLLGRMPFVVDEVRASLSLSPDVMVLTGTSLEDTEAAFRDHRIDTVIMGAGIALDTRLEIVRLIFEASEATSVHMKDRASGRTGMMPFVKAVLRGQAPVAD